jgi:biotin carboxylase
LLILLSDGAGLAARQCAILLSQAGHQVEALSPDPLCLCRVTRRVRRVHRVPPLGADPFGWLDAALSVAAARSADVLLPVQEQVAVMSACLDRIEAAGLATAVPDFTALARVQDKVSAHRTLASLGIPQPSSAVVTSAAEVTRFPAFVKMPIGTASAGVRYVSDRAELDRAELDGLDLSGGALVQEPVDGRLVMVQSVFAHGSLVAFHACERVREGANGAASHKLAVARPEVADHVAALGAALGWHGALSADVIDGQFIDINPRLVEPVNAFRSGVDLVGALLSVALSGTAPVSAPSRPGARTHQLLMAVLGAAQHGGRRRDVLRELGQAIAHSGEYRRSTEELTPFWSPPVLAASAETLVSPSAWRLFTGGATTAYSLTPAAWQRLRTDWLDDARPKP